MPIRAACREANGSLAEPPRLALDAEQTDPVVNDQVRTSVLPERQKHAVACIVEREHDCQGRSIADSLRVSHQQIVAQAADGPRPKNDSAVSPTMFFVPE
jgi:hypothetical protein